MKIIVTVEDADGSKEGDLSGKMFASVLQEMADLYVRKSFGYGEAWREQGWMGNLARILSKTARLRNLAWRPDPMNDAEESVGDTLLDLANLAIFGLLNRRDGNFWGRR